MSCDVAEVIKHPSALSLGLNPNSSLQPPSAASLCFPGVTRKERILLSSYGVVFVTEGGWGNVCALRVSPPHRGIDHTPLPRLGSASVCGVGFQLNYITRPVTDSVQQRGGWVPRLCHFPLYRGGR